VRANILLTMANLSKKTLVLCTGNKSELLVGFETLGGDLLGGFAPIKDLFKSEVVQLAVARNRFEKRRSNSLIIPNFIIERKPTAELWPDEFDEDELGEYSKIEESFELRKLNDFAYTASFKEDRFYRNEFKRRVAPIGPKLSNLSLNSIEYRFPINHIG
jgi:NAD+ synthetase